MKINIGPYKNWYGPYQVAEFIFFWATEKDEIGITRKKEWVHKIGEFFAYGFTDDEETWFYKFLKWIDKKKNRRVKIKIDKYDTWNMDRTLAMIVLPMLIQLKDTKHGSPYIDDEDVPDELKSTSAPPKQNDWDTDDNFFKRWDWVLDEIIWAFTQLQPDVDWEEQYITGEWKKDTFEIDKEGIKKHDERMRRGFVLFGKYFRSLWD